LLDASSKNLVSWLAVFLFLERVRDSTEMPPHPILKQLPTSSEPYAAVKRDVIARGILTNWEDLARKLRAISTPTPANAKPIQWKYSDRPAASAVTLPLPSATSSSQIAIVMREVSGS